MDSVSTQSRSVLALTGSTGIDQRIPIARLNRRFFPGPAKSCPPDRVSLGLTPLFGFDQVQACSAPVDLRFDPVEASSALVAL